MKKLIIVLLFASIILTACSLLSKDTMSIKPSEISKETAKVLELLDNELQFFDITLNETAKSYTMSVWVYRNGEWFEDGKIAGGIEFLPGQIAMRLTDSSYDLYVIDKNGHAKYSYPVLETGFENSNAIGGTRIDDVTLLELNEETPIWVKLGTDTRSMSVLDITEDFRTFNCNAGIAITLTVSDKVVE